MSPITKISFSNAGDRLVTGSDKDGAARVWAFNSKWERNEHFVINLSHEGGDKDTPKKKGKGRQRNATKQARSGLLNVCWSCNDAYIFTLQTVPVAQERKGPTNPDTYLPKAKGTRLKVWDSFTGELLQAIHISQCECHILVPHPHLPAVVVTGGWDGIICMWDTESREKYFQFRCVFRECMK